MRKLFWDDPYKLECDATVTKVDGSKIYLDQTVFFAFSGGQASDSGTIENVPVQDAVKEDSGEIYYTLENNKIFEAGKRVHVAIDAENRNLIMRLHSATHIVYYILIQKIGKQEIIGSNISRDKGRLDFLYEKSIADVLPEVEAEANKLVEKGLEIKTYENKEKPGRRFWEMEEIKMPCGGTHPRNTKEIGKIRLKRKNIGAGKERVEVLIT
ncbi:MAG: alanyl-tRNA editing protein [Candidatus Aenigmatarchaeota archaeon]